jgi:hypothetical protein
MLRRVAVVKADDAILLTTYISILYFSTISLLCCDSKSYSGSAESDGWEMLAGYYVVWCCSAVSQNRLTSRTEYEALRTGYFRVITVLVYAVSFTAPFRICCGFFRRLQPQLLTFAPSVHKDWQRIKTLLFLVLTLYVFLSFQMVHSVVFVS